MRLERHEVLGHVRQAEERGSLYLPVYLGEQVWNAFIYQKAFNDPFLRYIHSMEIDADRRAGLEHIH